MQTFTDLPTWRATRISAEFRDCRIGFVPTMGALHAGHRALFERARAENDRVVASIFVNPTQFDDPADLARYPRTLESDLALADGLVDVVLAPDAAQLYKDSYAYRVTESPLSLRWEGRHRAGHFDGVLTVVMKLLNLVQPQRAYFGEKDWQQLQLVRGMAAAFFIPTEIIGCPTVREEDGLALSSRNARLSPVGRSRAAKFPALLRSANSAAATALELRAHGFEVDYVDDHEGMRLGAVRIDGVRLIDNVRL